MSQPTTLVVTAIPNPDAAEAMQSYLKGVLPLLQSAGGKLVKRLKVTDVLAGQQAYGMVLVMDFESKETVSQMFDSDGVGIRLIAACNLRRIHRPTQFHQLRAVSSGSV